MYGVEQVAKPRTIPFASVVNLPSRSQIDTFTRLL